MKFPNGLEFSFYFEMMQIRGDRASNSNDQVMKTLDWMLGDGRTTRSWKRRVSILPESAELAAHALLSDSCFHHWSIITTEF